MKVHVSLAILVGAYIVMALILVVIDLLVRLSDRGKDPERDLGLQRYHRSFAQPRAFIAALSIARGHYGVVFMDTGIIVGNDGGARFRDDPPRTYRTFHELARDLARSDDGEMQHLVFDSNHDLVCGGYGKELRLFPFEAYATPADPAQPHGIHRRR